MTIKHLIFTSLLCLIIILGAFSSASATETQIILYDLLVLAPEEFEDALRPLIRHKNDSGMQAYFLSLEDIYASFTGIDHPEKIKKAIAHYEENYSIRYVMLVGDANQFPIRWIKGHFNDHMMDDDVTWNDDILYLPSDYYYADLYSSGGAFNGWDGDGDGFYGETYIDNLNPDGIDFTADVMVGRVPASDENQVRTYVAKIIRYEYLSSSWPIKRLLVAQDHSDFPAHIHFKEDIAAAFSDVGSYVTRLYDDVDCCAVGEDPDDTGCYPCGGTIDDIPNWTTISDVFNDGVDFVDVLNHSNPTSWGFFNVNNVNYLLTQTERLPIIYSGGCETAKFFGDSTLPYGAYLGVDDLTYGPVSIGYVGSAYYPNPQPLSATANIESIAEAFLVSGDYGGIAYYGSTETGEPGFHGTMEQAFFLAYTEGAATLGEMWLSAHNTFVERYRLRTLTPDGGWHAPAYVNTVSRLMLFGDPSLRVEGVSTISDLDAPMTSLIHPGEWQSDISLSAVDQGENPSGVYRTWFKPFWSSSYFETRHHEYSSEGEHTLYYFSEDMVGNVEAEQSLTVRVDMTPPTASVLYDGAEPATVFCYCMYPPCDCPERGCFNEKVQVSINAEDALSGVEDIYYALGGDFHEYTTPFEVHAGNYLTAYTIRYYSVDAAGNRSMIHSDNFCVTDFQAGLLRDEIRILAGLEEIIAMQLQKKFIDTLPGKISQIAYFYGAPSNPDWVPMGSDFNGDDGWEVQYDTTKMANGIWNIRLDVYGEPPGVVSPTADPLLYTEILSVIVNNLDSAKYQFELLPDIRQAKAEEVVTYTFKIINKTDKTLQNLKLIAHLDLPQFSKLEALDGGILKEGLPSWSRSSLEAGESWQVRFLGTLASLTPGTPVSVQGMLSADGYAQLLSDDPETIPFGDYSLVSLVWLTSNINGSVLEDLSLTPLSATVSLNGTGSYSTGTDNNGQYSFSEVPRGSYTLSVEAPGYEYHSPEGPTGLTAAGYGEVVTQDFFLKGQDNTAPRSWLDLRVDDWLRDSPDLLSGGAEDPMPGSGLSRVEVQIRRDSDSLYWNGTGWTPAPSWLLADGLESWSLNTSAMLAYTTGMIESSDSTYAVFTRATDQAGNPQTPHQETSSPSAPLLLSPPDGSSVSNGSLQLDWTDVVNVNATYSLLIAKDAAFNFVVLDSPKWTFLSEYQISDLLPAGHYYWKVHALSETYEPGAWSEVWEFDLIGHNYLPIILR